jgi:hypothetical protein
MSHRWSLDQVTESLAAGDGDWNDGIEAHVSIGWDANGNMSVTLSSDDEDGSVTEEEFIVSIRRSEPPTFWRM